MQCNHVPAVKPLDPGCECFVSLFCVGQEPLSLAWMTQSSPVLRANSESRGQLREKGDCQRL